jgi:hypothetical protein
MEINVGYVLIFLEVIRFKVRDLNKKEDLLVLG